MDEQEFTYRYFRLPHQFSHFLFEPRRCDICGWVRGVYEMTLRGEAEATEGIRYVCDKCLSNGKLVERGAWVNLANMKSLRADLARHQPELSPDDNEWLARERTVEVEQRTPHPLTWQDLFWPAHCGDYCRYEREVGKPDVLALADDRDIISFIEDGLHDDAHAAASAQTIWETIRPDSPKGLAPAYDIGVYLFQCLVCDRYLLLWDAN
jgi:uncharacterized protein CbrC (UPF0167 family)